MPSSVRPDFRTRWRGYDPNEVERFLEDLAAERRYLHERVASLEALCAEQREASAVALRLARTEADGIKARAEQEARRVLESAEQAAARALRERLDANRADLDRLNAARADIKQWIESSIMSMREAHDLIAGQLKSSPTATAPSSRPVVPDSIDAPVAEAVVAEEADEGTPVPLWRRRSAWFGAGAIAVLATVLISASTHSRVHGVASTLPKNVATPASTPSSQPSVKQAEPPRTPLRASTPDRPSEDDGLVLVLSAKRGCWIRTVVDGAQPMERVMKAGEVIFVRARDEALLRVGDATALNLTINGRPAKPLGREGEVTTHRISRANYKGLLQG